MWGMPNATKVILAHLLCVYYTRELCMIVVITRWSVHVKFKFCILLQKFILFHFVMFGCSSCVYVYRCTYRCWALELLFPFGLFCYFFNTLYNFVGAFHYGIKFHLCKQSIDSFVINNILIIMTQTVTILIE